MFRLGTRTKRQAISGGATAKAYVDIVPEAGEQGTVVHVITLRKKRREVGGVELVSVFAVRQVVIEPNAVLFRVEH